MAEPGTEQTYDVARVPQYDAGVLSDTALDRPDAGLREQIVNTGDVIADLYEEERPEGGLPGGVVLRPKRSLQLAEEALKSLANELAFQFTKGNHDEIPIVEEAFYDLINEIMTAVYQDDLWLHGIAYEIATLPNPDSAIEMFRARVMTYVDLNEILQLQQIEEDAARPETKEMYESESDDERRTEAELWEGVKEWGMAAQNYKPPAESQVQAMPPVVPPTDPQQLGCVAEYTLAKTLASLPGNDIRVPPPLGSYVHGYIQQHYRRTMPYSTKVFDRAIYDWMTRRGTISDLMKSGGLSVRELILEFGMMTRTFNKYANRWFKTRLKPDIVDFSGPPGEMYEIKSRRSLDEAVIQLFGYKWCYDQVIDPRKHPLRFGTRYRPPRFIPVGTKYFALPYKIDLLPGIIAYNLYLKPETQRRRIEKVQELSMDAKIAIGMAAVVVTAALLLMLAGAAGATAAAAGAGTVATVTTLPTATATGATAGGGAGLAKAAAILLGVMTAEQLASQEEAALRVAAQPDLVQ